MAEHKASPLQLQWQRGPTGEFVIQMVATFPDDKGKLRAVVVRSWSLTPKEEENLKHALTSGLMVATSLPGNGHRKE